MESSSSGHTDRSCFSDSLSSSIPIIHCTLQLHPDCSFSAYSLCQYYVMFFLCKLSYFDILLAIDNFLTGLSVNFREFPSRFLKCSFHFYILSSWLTAFSFILKMFCILLTSFTVCHTIHDCLSSTKLLILLISRDFTIKF